MSKLNPKNIDIFDCWRVIVPFVDRVSQKLFFSKFQRTFQITEKHFKNRKGNEVNIHARCMEWPGR